ncbi:MAG: hypothetical protein IIV72_08215 [Alistipes sp.]|nr:hypothetical protein [Alistipes sp.]
MSRARINNIIKGYADSVGYGYDTDIVPTALAGGTKFPAIFWNAPNAEWSDSQARWRYPSTIYIIADAGAQDVTALLDELQDHALRIHKALRNDARAYAEGTFSCKPMTGFDNTTTAAIEMTVNIYYDGGC